MVKFKLQLFAYTGNSIVDYLKSEGKDSSFAARKKIAESYGITNYTGTASQNTQLLNYMRSGSSSAKATTNTQKTNTSATPATTTNPTFKGVDQKYVDMAYQDYKPSEKETEYQTKSETYIKGAEDKINKGFQQSDTVTQAFDYLNGKLDYFKEGKTSWDEKIYGQISAIENREKFVYDVDNDTLFQQALASAMNSGKTAMEDTIGQASSLTGGYGSTYATSAGNQAYNSFIEDAYDNLPQYYQMALSAYQAEGEEMYNLLGVYTQMGEQEWGRNMDAYNTVFDFATNQRDFEYGMYQDDINNTIGLANSYDSMYQNEMTKNMTLWQQDIDNAWKTINQQSGDYWSQTELDYKKERDAISDQQWQQTFGLQEKEYRLSTGDTNGDGILSDAEKAAMNTTYSYDSDGNVVKGTKDTETYKTPTQTQKQKALEAYNNGGEEEYFKYLDSLPSDIDVDEIDIYVKGNGKKEGEKGYVKGYGELPLSQRTFTVVDDGGVNWFGGVDNNVIVEDQYGHKHKLSDLKKTDKDLAKAISKLKKGETYTAGK